MIAAIEIIRFVHRRVVVDRVRPSGDRTGETERAAQAARGSTVARVLTNGVAALAYVFGLLATAFGVLVFLSRYEGTVGRTAFSLLGASIALFGLLVLAIAAGVRRAAGCRACCSRSC